ncbi:MAG: transporter substrate-binding domain-containing protein [Micromonosporaceae bacterium]|nr:transporter substrate-binding domain-containing protein [Micromonosporaceae bacterium]
MNVFTTRLRRRLGAGAATAALLLAVTGCGGGDTDAGKVKGVSLIKSDQLTVCTHLPYKPFQFKQGGEVVGFDVDLLDLLAKDLGVDMEVVDIEWTQITSGAAFAAKKCDIGMGAMTITDERAEAIGITDPYMDATQVLMVKKGAPYKSLEDLKGKKIGVQTDTTGEEYAKNQEEGIGYSIVPFDDLALQTNAVKAGKVDAAINDNGVLYDFVNANPDVAVVAEFDTGEQYGFPAKKDDPQGGDKLIKRFNKLLAQAQQDGTYNQIYKTWFGVEPKQP